MKKRTVFYSCLSVCATVLTCMFVSQCVNAGTINLHVDVDPLRTIVVDKQNRIVTITSNTRTDVPPVVFLDREGGQRVEYSPALKAQYEKIKSSLGFNDHQSINIQFRQ